MSDGRDKKDEPKESPANLIRKYFKVNLERELAFRGKPHKWVSLLAKAYPHLSVPEQRAGKILKEQVTPDIDDIAQISELFGRTPSEMVDAPGEGYRQALFISPLDGIRFPCAVLLEGESGWQIKLRALVAWEDESGKLLAAFNGTTTRHEARMVAHMVLQPDAVFNGANVALVLAAGADSEAAMIARELGKKRFQCDILRPEEAQLQLKQDPMTWHDAMIVWEGHEGLLKALFGNIPHVIVSHDAGSSRTYHKEGWWIQSSPALRDIYQALIKFFI